MKIFYSPRFARQFKKLPKEIKGVAKERGKIFRKNPFDSRLKTHKLKGVLLGYWSFSLTYNYRIMFEFKDEHTVWLHSIGNHNIYE